MAELFLALSISKCIKGNNGSWRMEWRMEGSSWSIGKLDGAFMKYLDGFGGICLLLCVLDLT